MSAKVHLVRVQVVGKGKDLGEETIGSDMLTEVLRGLMAKEEVFAVITNCEGFMRSFMRHAQTGEWGTVASGGVALQEREAKSISENWSLYLRGIVEYQPLAGYGDSTTRLMRFYIPQ